MILSNYFSTPIWEDILPLDYNSIVEKVLARKHTSDGRIISNLGGWQSDHINIDFPDLYKSVDRMLKLDPSLSIKRNGQAYQITA
jgi:hypothetical protein